MIPADLITALGLPAGSRVDRRVPKKMLVEHGAPTAADKRQINEGIEELQWVAALKPGTVGVPAYRDEKREYLEIAVLSLQLRAGAKAPRLVELVHRAIPYPVLLVAGQDSGPVLTLAHKRWSQGEAGKTVLDGDLVETPAAGELERAIWSEFTGSLAIARQPKESLLALYQGWIDAVHALRAAALTGAFRPAGSPDRAAGRAQALKDCEELEARIAALRSAAKKEKQMARQVELNLEIKRLQAELAAAREKL